VILASSLFGLLPASYLLLKGRVNVDLTIYFGFCISIYISIVSSFLLYISGVSFSKFTLFIFVVNSCIFLKYKKVFATPDIFIERNHFFGIAICYSLISFGLYTDDPVFTSWDGIVSWYRWATEIHDHAYNPYNAFYPLLWPGLWAFYGSIGNQYFSEAFSKISISISLITFIFGCFLVIGQESKRLVVYFILLALFCFLLNKGFYSGYVDNLVALYWAVNILVLHRIVEITDNLTNTESQAIQHTDTLCVWIVLASTLVACGSIGKQSGFLLIPLFLATLSLLLRRRLPGSVVAVMALSVGISLAPLALNYLVYDISADFGLNDISERLKALAVKKAGGAGNSLYMNAWSLLPLNYLVGVSVFWIAYISWRRQLPTLMIAFNIITLSILAFAFVYAANCCGYAERSFIWITTAVMALLSANLAQSYKLSALLPQASPAIWSVRISFNSLCALFLIGTFAWLIILVGARSMEGNALLESRGHTDSVSALLRISKDQRAACTIFLLQDQPLRFNPKLAALKSEMIQYSEVDNLGWPDDRLISIASGDDKWLAGKINNPDCAYYVAFYAFDEQKFASLIKSGALTIEPDTRFVFALTKRSGKVLPKDRDLITD
jgi:hypothetical protein